MGDRTRADRTLPDVSAGWRDEYRAQGVAPEPSTENMTTRTEPIERRACQFCDEWAGPSNRYPNHLTECAGVGNAAPIAPVRADGGDPNLRADAEHADARTYELPDHGELVVDREAENPEDSLAYVVETFPEATAAGWYLEPLEQTVAGANPEYAPGAPVVRVAFLEDGQDAEDVRRAAEQGDAREYDYPAPRLDAAPDKGGEHRA